MKITDNLGEFQKFLDSEIRMIPPKEEKRYHPESSFFSFFGNLHPNNSRELTKKGNLNQMIRGIKNTLEVVAVYFLVKRFEDLHHSKSTEK